MFLSNLDLVNSYQDQLKLFLYSLVIWTSLFLLINSKIKLKSLAVKYRDDTINRFISILHGTIAFWYSFLVSFYDWPSYSDQNTWHQQFCMIMSMAYFAYDFIACIIYGLADNATIAHHSFTMIGYGVCVIQKYGATTTLLGVFYAESSNLAMHLRCILRNCDLRFTRVYNISEWTYFGLYIIFRGIFAPILIIRSWTYPCIPKFVTMSATLLYLQSIYYIIEMRKIFKRHFIQIKERFEKKIHYHWFSVNPKVQELSYTQRNQKKDKIF